MSVLHRVVALGSVSAILAIAFYGGVKSFDHDSSFSLNEVYSLQKTCDDGQFIGTCQPCTECKGNEFDAGGCSYFRDSLCLACEPIDNCAADVTSCTTQRDSTCSQCDHGYYGDSCKKCDVCPRGSFQVRECSQDLNTVCSLCSPCQNGFRVTKACTPMTDTECTPCSQCLPGTYLHKACETLPSSIPNVWEYVYDNLDIVYTLQDDTVCNDCTPSCGPGKYTSEMCTVIRDTSCSDCASCDNGEFISQMCELGTSEDEGTDTLCQDCQTRPGSDDGNFWELSPCLSTADSDAIYMQCSECKEHEYLHTPCGETHDTVCPQCTPIKHCKQFMESCTDGTDSICTECEDGWFGEQCCYHQTFGNCGHKPARERHPTRLGYGPLTDTDALVAFCTELCTEFPDCMAMELIDGGSDYLKSGPNKLGGSDTVCHFMASYTTKTMTDPSMDCYANVCRQGSGYHPGRNH